MRLTKLRVVFFFFIVSTCGCGIVIEPLKPQQLELLKTVVNVFKDCYVNRVSTVGIAGNDGGLISEPLWVRELIPVTLIDRTRRIVSHGPIDAKSRYKLHLFFIIATSSSTLSESLKGIEESKWRNHMASVLIIDWSIPGCSNMFEMLWTAWEMDLIASNVLCLHETKGWLIYTYNPYTSKAPKPWNLENAYTGKNDHTWTLFVRRYREADDICNKLDFDKTADLGGYMIRTSVANITGVFVERNLHKNGTDRLGGLYAEIAWTLYRALNATPMILEPSTYDNVDNNGKLIGVPAELNNGFSDFAVNIRYRLFYENTTVTYPFWETGLYIMSQYRGSASQLSKIASVIDSYSKLGLYLVCLITVIFFACFLRYSVSSALLNTLLLICNAALLKIPKNLAPRIYLATIFIFVVNIQGMYQGKLASLLTKKVDLRNVETVEDLSKYGFTVYGPPRLAGYFNDPDSRINYSSIITTGYEKCFNYVRQSSRVACALEKNALLRPAVKFKLYMSTKPTCKSYWTYMMRDNWPPGKRLNTVLRRLVEGNIIQIMYEKEVGKYLRTLQAIKDMKNDQSFEVLTLPELTFAFMILAIGLICASICFMMEMVMSRIQSRRSFPFVALKKIMNVF